LTHLDKALNLLKKLRLQEVGMQQSHCPTFIFPGYIKKKISCLANFWFALAFKKDSFTFSQLDVKIPDCSDGDKITVLE
jgi:hypothetical protein